MRYPVVFMDVGGTLIGPRSSFGATYSRVFADFGLHCEVERFNTAIFATWQEMSRSVPAGADRYTHFEGGENAFWRQFVQRAVELATGEVVGDQLAEAALKGLQARFGSAEAWFVFEDVIPALAALCHRGVRLAVVSNWDSRLTNVLKLLDLDRWFETVVVSYYEGVEKPDAAIFTRALERMGVAASEALHVGDSPELDGGGAYAAGLDWVWVDRRNPDNAKAISDFNTLPAIVENGLPKTF